MGFTNENGGEVSSPGKEHELVRGKRAEFNEGMLQRVQFLLSQNQYKDAEDFVRPLKLSSDFSGTLFSVSFNCSRSIALTKLGFWGPAEANSIESYDVRVIIFVGVDPYKEGQQVGSIRSTVQAQGQDVFCLNLEDPIRIESNTWCRIKFRLDGPRTCICGSVEPTYVCKDSGTVFEFGVGSNQLPKLYYTL